MTPDSIRATRQRLNLTQEALATRLNVSIHTVRGWEKGDRQPGPANVAKLTALASSPEVRAMTLTQSLDAAADLADANAQADIADGHPEAAETAMRVAEHLRRIAQNHRESGVDPVQQA